MNMLMTLLKLVIFFIPVNEIYVITQKKQFKANLSKIVCFKFEIYNLLTNYHFGLEIICE